ncbi:TRAP transporter large permease [Natronincola ferrireducens]|uniref:TRAP transporter, DctM subunit n=1 Tax=Natronincola ferrireducens TaxID=393762 RepID=A0A1G8YR63_9FIRM|nr:TRAP transporter large permease [Natronincola ferrireducens]SDK05291.1 TRAP transporter, DctM subunit [Natronincola ferrireducens]
MTVEIIGITILLGIFFLLMFLKIPIAFAMGISSIVTAIYLDIPTIMVFQRMVNGLNSFTFLAVPFFIVAGQIMSEGGISKRLIKFSNVLVGKIRGGMAVVNVFASMLFGGISGSSVADVSSIGSFLIPMMEENGYDKDYSVAVTVTSSVQGVIIPPSQNVIYYSLAAGGLSVGKLFLGGYIPGIILGLALMFLSYGIAVKRNYPKGQSYTLKESISIILDALIGLFTVVIIMGGILFGIFTATESAAIATVYAFIVTWLVYRELGLKKMYKVLKDSVQTLSIIVAIIGTSSAFAFLLAYLRVPTMVTNLLLGISDNRIVIILLINLLLLVLGMLMDMGILILLLTPILLPVAIEIGMDPIQFGIMMMLNLGIGLCTPPVGTSLFVGCAIAKLKIENSIKALLPFYAVMVAVLLLVIFAPGVVMFLPNLMD